MLKTKLLLLLFVFITQFSFSQKMSRADRFFEKGDYINAALQYEEQMNLDGYSKHLLENISTSYYNTFSFRNAYRYLKVLTEGKFYEKDKTFDNKYNFMMYHVLSALGEHEKSMPYLALYKKNNEVDGFEKSKALTTIEKFKLKDDDYKIEIVDFNSDASEFGAVKRDSTVYFTTDRKNNGPMDKSYKWTHRSFLDIYKVTVDEENKATSDIESMSKELNSKLHEGNFCFTADGNTIYISKSNSDKGKKKYDSLNTNAVHLYKSIKKDNKWTKPKKLSFNNLNYSIQHPALNADGSKLYFSSNMPGGHGDFDIYYVSVMADSIYGKPVNLGKIINTENREQFPFVSEAGDLFFSSNGHLGMGMMDIFASELIVDKYKKPVNLGAPINSSYDDFSMHYYNEKDGFFASNRKKVGDDIYKFSQIGEIFPREYRARFVVKDFRSREFIPNSQATLIDEDKHVIFDKKFDSVSSINYKIFAGNFSFTAKAKGYKTKTAAIEAKEKDGKTYTLFLERDVNKKPDTTKVKETDIAQNKEDIKLTKKQIKGKLLSDSDGPPVIEKDGKLYFKMPPIYFDYDKWNIRADSKKELDKLAKKLERYKSVYINIGSHTDSRGSDSYNQKLSEKRAESTRNYLALEGYVNARRMKFNGYGESVPIVKCEDKICSEKEHQINRRSEFEIVKF